MSLKSFEKLPVDSLEMLDCYKHLLELPPVSQSLITTLSSALKKLSVENYALAFSGGLDSSLLLYAFVSHSKKIPRLFVLTTPSHNRDRRDAHEVAQSFGAKVEEVIVDLGAIMKTIQENQELLKNLPDYTHRILAVCEIQMAKFASSHGLNLIVGHGPESILGGFVRRKLPSLNDWNSIEKTLLQNLVRLNAISKKYSIEIFLPFLVPEVFASLLSLQKNGMVKSGLSSLLPNGTPLQSKKASLQNGSGIHYLFEKAMEKKGFKRTRDALEDLLS